MSVAQLQVELSKLTAEEKLELAGFLAQQKPGESTSSTALLAEPALAVDWNRPEEDEAWQHLQKAK